LKLDFEGNACANYAEKRIRSRITEGISRIRSPQFWFVFAPCSSRTVRERVRSRFRPESVSVTHLLARAFQVDCRQAEKKRGTKRPSRDIEFRKVVDAVQKEKAPSDDPSDEQCDVGEIQRFN
jgi:hypothetical protein